MHRDYDRRFRSSYAWISTISLWEIIDELDSFFGWVVNQIVNTVAITIIDAQMKKKLSK